MNKILIALFFMTFLFSGSNRYDGGSAAPVVLAGSIVKNIGNEPVKKYPRKNCPVCKGTGKYLSGDGIKMVDCGYCEIEKGAKNTMQSTRTQFCKCAVCTCKNCGCYQ
jgi:hypothetical protein